MEEKETSGREGKKCKRRKEVEQGLVDRVAQKSILIGGRKN